MFENNPRDIIQACSNETYSAEFQSNTPLHIINTTANVNPQ